MGNQNSDSISSQVKLNPHHVASNNLANFLSTQFKVFKKFNNLVYLVNAQGQQLLKINHSGSSYQDFQHSYFNQGFLKLRKQRETKCIPTLLMYEKNTLNSNKVNIQATGFTYILYSHPTKSLKQEVNERIQLGRKLCQNQVISIIYNCIKAFEQIRVLVQEFQAIQPQIGNHLRKLSSNMLISDQTIFIDHNGKIIFSDVLAINKLMQSIGTNTEAKQENNLFKKNLQKHHLVRFCKVVEYCLSKMIEKNLPIKSKLTQNQLNFSFKQYSIEFQLFYKQLLNGQIGSYEQAKKRLQKISKSSNENEKSYFLKQKQQFYSQKKNRYQSTEKINGNNKQKSNHQHPVTKIRLSLRKNDSKPHPKIEIKNKQNVEIRIEKQTTPRKSEIKNREIHKLKSRKNSRDDLRRTLQCQNSHKKPLHISQHSNPISYKNILKSKFLKKDKSKPIFSNQIIEPINFQSKPNETNEHDQIFSPYQAHINNPLSVDLIENLSSIISNHGSITLSLSNALNEQLRTQISQINEEQIQNNEGLQSYPANHLQLLKKCSDFLKEVEMKSYYENDSSLLPFHANSQSRSLNQIPQFLKKFKLPQKNLLALNNIILKQKDMILQESFEQSQLNSYRQSYDQGIKLNSKRNSINKAEHKVMKNVCIEPIKIKVLEQSCQMEDIDEDSVEKQIIGLQNSLEDFRLFS